MIVGIVAVTGALLFEVLHTPAGVERETQIRQRRIYSRTRTATHARPDEVIRLLQTDWSWWKKARAEEMKDLGDGRRELLLHPNRFFNVLELPTTLRLRLEPVETLADGVEVRGSLSLMPLQMVAAVHSWRERLGVEGLRDRLKAIRPETAPDPGWDN